MSAHPGLQAKLQPNLEQLMAQHWAILGCGREAQALVREIKRRDADAVVHIFCEQAPDLAEDFPLSAQDTLMVAPFDTAVLSQYETLIKSPGISPYHPALVGLAKTTQVTSTTNLWLAERLHERVIAITGTKGKSTTAALLAHILRESGISVQLAGNIGVPLIEHISTQADWWIVELSSYQTADLMGEVELGVVLSLFPEHLDWHGSEQRYMQDKLRLLTVAREAWAPITLKPSIEKYHVNTKRAVQYLQQSHQLQSRPEGIVQDDHLLFAATSYALRGQHNLYNLAIAWELARHVGLSDQQIAAAAMSFRALPHRLEVLDFAAPLRFINDSISTTPHATIAALEAFHDQQVSVLVGGHDRGLAWQVFVDYVRQNPVHAVIAMGEQGRKIQALWNQSETEELQHSIHWAPDLPQAFALACRISPAGCHILLSPGAPSYGEFKDFAARGDCFRQLALSWAEAECRIDGELVESG